MKSLQPAKNLLEPALPCLSLFFKCSTIEFANGIANSSSDILVFSFSINPSKDLAKANLYVAEFFPNRIIALH
jgi:hypothetical protein